MPACPGTLGHPSPPPPGVGRFQLAQALLFFIFMYVFFVFLHFYIHILYFVIIFWGVAPTNGPPQRHPAPMGGPEGRLKGAGREQRRWLDPPASPRGGGPGWRGVARPGGDLKKDRKMSKYP